jgi:hypothetical protein
MPGAPLLRRTATHARHKTSLRKTLSRSAWNRRPGSALAARYSACCKARTGSNTDPDAAGLAETALTGHHPSATRIDEAAALPSPAVMLSARLQQYYGRLRLPPGTRSTSRREPVIGPDTPARIRSTPGRGGSPQFPPPPSERSAPHTPGSSSRLRSRSYTASMAFTLNSGARHSLCPTNGETSNDAAGFASCYGPLSRSP